LLLFGLSHQQVKHISDAHAQVFLLEVLGIGLWHLGFPLDGPNLGSLFLAVPDLVLGHLFLEVLPVSVPLSAGGIRLLLEVSGDLQLIALLFLDIGGVLRVVALIEDAFQLRVYVQLLEVILLRVFLVGEHLHEAAGVHAQHARLGDQVVLQGVVSLVTEFHFLQVKLDAHVRHIDVPQGYITA